ncbi:DUF5682 family protein [Verrucomicrobiaceae bacterium 227]
MTIYGIRHHGPGCARSLVKALSSQEPDLILIESPLETEALFEEVLAEGMKPPIAMLVYQSDSPGVASFYPFARFSPEWQASLWAAENKVPVRAFDLPAAHSFALKAEDEDVTETAETEDAFSYFAKADGYTDGERWWNDKVEERSSSGDFFAAILEGVGALRQELKREESRHTLLREAWMRRCLRQAKKDGFENIAVVCGAWHAPALTEKITVAADNALLKGLPKAKVAVTWTPWTYSRLTTASGYGAGVRAPGWYDHLWSQPHHSHISWLTKAARILRKQDLEGSSASIIEASRLSESLAGMRGRPRPGLDESLEAIQTVFCSGEASPLAFLNEKLLIGKKLGSLPEGLSTLPLQQDIEATQKRLRLKPTAGPKELILDLREEGGRNRSRFLHRLLALDISWGEKKRTSGKGTFKELWKLLWQPSILLSIIDASRHGNTLESAAEHALLDLSKDPSLEEISGNLDLAILADLPGASAALLRRLDAAAATAHETLDLLKTVITLAGISRYGDVRQSDTSLLTKIVSHLATRCHLEMPGAVTGIDDEAADVVIPVIQSYFTSLETLENEALMQDLFAALLRIADRSLAHPQGRGLAVRLLRDVGELSPEKVETALSFALSSGTEPSESAAWLQGFLAGMGGVLVHDRALLSLINGWVDSLGAEHFQNILPLLRRLFGSFTSPERASIGTAVQQGNFAVSAKVSSTMEIDEARALPALATVARLLNLPAPS